MGVRGKRKKMQLSVPDRRIADSFFGLGAKFGPSSFFFVAFVA